MLVSTCRKLSCLSARKKQNSSSFFSEDIPKILQTSYFEYFGHTWLLPSKTIMPTCRNFGIYLHAKNELHP